MPKISPTALAWIGGKYSNEHLLAGYNDGSVAIWDISSGERREQQPLSENSSPVIEMHYDAKSSRIAVTTEFYCHIMHLQKGSHKLSRPMGSRRFKTVIGGMGQVKLGAQIVLSFPVEKKLSVNTNPNE
jgi:hypothetical protein